MCYYDCIQVYIHFKFVLGAYSYRENSLLSTCTYLYILYTCILSLRCSYILGDLEAYLTSALELISNCKSHSVSIHARLTLACLLLPHGCINLLVPIDLLVSADEKKRIQNNVTRIFQVQSTINARPLIVC